MESQLSPLLTTFDGWLKHHKPTKNNLWGDAVFKLAFPQFDPPVWTTEKMNEARARAPKTLTHQFFQFEQNRRWGGWDLPRGRYYSVAIDERGGDGGTLAAELRAYRNREEQGMIVDVLDAVQVAGLKTAPIPDQVKDVLDACVVIFIFPATRLRQSVEALQSPELYRPGRESQLALLDDHTRVLVLLMPVIERAQIPNVVDLRLPNTRAHFFRLFQTGHDLTVKDQMFRKDSGTNISGFLGMLPDFIAPEIGGTDEGQGGLTQGLGMYLRAAGVSGIVYPSARTEFGAEIFQGGLRQSWGWNFVDYRTSPEVFSQNVVDVDPWSTSILKGVKIHHTDSTDFAGSFQTKGLYKANCQLYEDSYGQGRRALFERLQNRQGVKNFLLLGTTNLDALHPESGTAVRTTAAARLTRRIKVMMSALSRKH